ncbi:MAG: trypsin-like peptidase domain-containing protein [bacterium]|nr:trypsin-like peptidase domain-containing protein [bacterium]
MSSEEIYGLVAPSIPVVETPVGTGSGILVEGGLVVTNYHVVWPYERVRVVFPDGTEFADVPVLAWDAFADLALLGPVDVSLPYLDLSDGEGMPPGSEVHLIGYRAETDLFPEPTITRGVLSRVREWELYGLTLLQTDADMAGGQSGGALVNSSGEVVGVSTWHFGDAGFALATSAADDVEILLWLIEDLEEFGPWGVIPGGTGATEFVLELENSLDSAFLVFEGEAGSILDIRIDGPSDGILLVVGPSGLVLDVDDTYGGLEHGTAELEVDGPHFVVVQNLGDTLDEASSFTLESNVPLAPFMDYDDGQVLSVGGSVAGVIDHYADTDWYSIELFEGETVVFWTEAIATDTAIYVGQAGGSFQEMVADDDSGPPLFGNHTNAELVFTAPTTGRYLVAVNDPVADGGAYFLGVDYAEPAAEGEVGGSRVGGEPTLGLQFDLDGETTWREVFEVFTTLEQDCTREELGDVALLEGFLASTVVGGGFDEEIPGVLRCLHHDTAMELMIAAIVARSAQEQVLFEADHVACLREVFAGEGGAEFLAAIVSDSVTEPEDFGELLFDFLLCLPEGFL